ncbi:MAG: hypothetical protein VX906_02325 [Candidatus Thermoplasmatota archaeon]|nr:hypothetical protein [Candidatus Thermoplasmatota archaeon]
MDETNPRFVGGEVLNLVQEAMARETNVDDKKSGKNPKNGRVRFFATLITWILLNLIWLQASHAVAVNEVNEHGRVLNGNYVLTIPDMLKMDRETNVDLNCDFKPINETASVVTVRLQYHESGSGDAAKELLWEGESDQVCPDMQLQLYPGKYNFYTTVILEDGSADVYPSRNLSAEMDLGIHIWEPFRVEGFIAANLLGLFLGIADRTIRQIMKRRNAAIVRNMPLHKRRQKEEWEQVMTSMSGGNAAEVNDLIGFQTSETDLSMELQRKNMRERFAAQAAEADGDTEEFVDETLDELEEELGKGTTEGLTGKVEEDRNIRTVGDLWRRLSGNEK